MSWQSVTLGSGKAEIAAWMRDDVIATVPKYKIVDNKIVVNGDSCLVISKELDARKEQLLITIAPKGAKKKEKSDDKSVKG